MLVDGVADAVAVDRYIETKRTVLRNADRIRNELVKVQGYLPAEHGGLVWDCFRKIENILDNMHGEHK